MTHVVLVVIKRVKMTHCVNNFNQGHLFIPACSIIVFPRQSCEVSHGVNVIWSVIDTKIRQTFGLLFPLSVEIQRDEPDSSSSCGV